MDFKVKEGSVWESLFGKMSDFSAENRAFNVVTVLSFIILFTSLVFDIYITQYGMAGVLFAAMLLAFVLYYYSRFRKLYKVGIVVFGLSSYLLTSINYFLNAGISGPSLMVFMLTFQLLAAISPQSFLKVWTWIHLSVCGVLLGIEYRHPQLAPFNYQSRFDQFLDMYWSYIAVILLMFLTTNYLRKYYLKEKQLAAERLVAIGEQNEQIKRQNELLERSNEEKNRLFSIVSHDLRGPMDTIRGFLEILSENILTEEERKDFEKQLLVQTKSTSELLLNLLYWSKTQMQGVTTQLALVKVAELVDDARAVLIGNAIKKNIKITYNIDKDLELIADKEMLRIIIRNLMNNAIKFTPNDGEVILKVEVVGKSGIISVKDNGIGISPQQKNEIFTLKSRSTYGTRGEKGVGLGLILCKEFTEYQKGEIWFESEEGKGSTFYIKLPVAQH